MNFLTFCRLFALVGGSIALYLAWFMYEDEEERLQNRLELWWLDYEDRRTRFVSSQAAFFSTIAARISEAISRLFPDRFGAFRKLASANAFLVATTFSALAAETAVKKGEHWLPESLTFLLLSGALFRLAWSAMRSRFSRVAVAVLFLAIPLAIVFTLVTGYYAQSGEDGGLPTYFAFDIAVLCVAPIAILTCSLSMVLASNWLLQHALRRAQEEGSNLGILWFAWSAGIAVLVVASVQRIVAGAFALLLSPGLISRFLARVLSVASAYPAIVAATLVGFATLLVLHRLVWPIAGRTLYSLQRHKVVKNKKLLNAVGMGLLVFSFSGSLSLLQKVIGAK